MEEGHKPAWGGAPGEALGESCLTARAPAWEEKGTRRAAVCLSRDDGFSPPRGRGLRELLPRPGLGDPGVGHAGAGRLGAPVRVWQENGGSRGLRRGREPQSSDPPSVICILVRPGSAWGRGPVAFRTKLEGAEGTREPGHSLGHLQTPGQAP